MKNRNFDQISNDAQDALAIKAIALLMNGTAYENLPSELKKAIGIECENSQASREEILGSIRSLGKNLRAGKYDPD